MEPQPVKLNITNQMMKTDELATWLENVIKGLVFYPDDVRVAVQDPDERGVLFTVKVNERDAGRVIGRAGANAQKIRAILNLAGLHHEIRANLKIDVPDIGTGDGKPRSKTF